MNRRIPIALLVMLGAAAGVGGDAADAGEDAMRPDLEAPDRHFRLADPADLDVARAERIYRRIRDDMAAAYALADTPEADAYLDWRRYNRAPYRSSRHGARYVNNYANALARGYGDPDGGGDLRVGAVFAKDSFTVTGNGDVFTGPLFLMEKMPAGFAPEQGNWRFTMIMPDGSLFGRTGGRNAGEVAFCADCHAGSGRRALFFVPRAYRARDDDGRTDADEPR